MITRRETRLCIELTKNILKYSEIKTTHTRAKLLKVFFDKLCTKVRKQVTLPNQLRICLKTLKSDEVNIAKMLIHVINNTEKRSGYLSNKSFCLRHGDASKMDIIKIKL